MLNKSSCKSRLSRHAETLRAANLASSTHVVTKQDDHNTSGRSRIKYGMTLNLMGFTLIELLVVVLIIGILASVALPQYQKAVLKTRLMQYIQYVSALQKGNMLYYMEHGEYATDVRDLDIDVTQKTQWNLNKPVGREMKQLPRILKMEIISRQIAAPVSMGKEYV